jgi:retinol dehydrogenase-12
MTSAMTMSAMAGRTVLITGANTGIGRATAVELARRGARLFLACRSEAKTAPVIEAIRRHSPAAKVDFLPLDLGDLESVRRCASLFLGRGEPLHVLLNNAGLGGTRGVTKQGFELAFGVNHLGHFLLTQLLLPRLRESAPARIVNVASKAHFEARHIDWEGLEKRTRTLTGLTEYEVSKLCNVLFTLESARRLKGTGVHSYACHPGVIASDVWRAVPWPLRALMTRKMATVEQGSAAPLYCATSPEVADHDGRYYDWTTCEVEPSALARDRDLAQTLWERSEAWVAAR